MCVYRFQIFFEAIDRCLLVFFFFRLHRQCVYVNRDVDEGKDATRVDRTIETECTVSGWMEYICISHTSHSANARRHTQIRCVEFHMLRAKESNPNARPSQRISITYIHKRDSNAYQYPKQCVPAHSECMYTCTYRNI